MPVASTAAMAAFKSSSPAPTLSSTTGAGYPISQSLSTTNPGPVQWTTALQGRPTLSGGIVGGRVSGVHTFPLRRPHGSVSFSFHKAHPRR